jgi:pilus assembly protein Flp/PilA
LRVVRFVPGASAPHGFAELHIADMEAVVKNLLNRTRTLMRDDSGQDLLEYALLVALIALVAVAAVTSSGQAVNTIFSQVATSLQQAAQAAGA